MIEPTDSAAIAAMSDDDLIDAYERTDGQPGHVDADALAAEIQQRGLDV